MTAESDAPADPSFLAALEKWRAAKHPGPHHALLARLAGTWEVRFRFHAGPQHWESACTAEAELLHGGRFLLERIEGEIHAPDAEGRMRPEPYSATWLLGYDGYKKAYVGSFIENQNSHLLTFVGRQPPGAPEGTVVGYGLSDEPMLEIQDATLKYVLEMPDADHRRWRLYALAAGDDALLYELDYSRRR